MTTLKKTGGIATLLVWLLAAQAFLTAIELLALANRYSVLHRHQLGHAVAPSTIHAADTAVKVTTNVIAAILIVTIVIWCIWQHRAQSNARELTAGGLHFSPGWAVGWWFVPIADLWMPFRTIRELWKGSHGPAWQGIRTWRLIGWWWALWLVSWIEIWTGSGSFSVGLGTESRAPVTSAQVISHDRWQLIAQGVRIVAALLAIAIVRSVTRLQAASQAREPAVVAPPSLPGGEVPLPPPPASPVRDAMGGRERTVLTISIVVVVCLSVGGLVWGSLASGGSSAAGATVYGDHGIHVTYPSGWSTSTVPPATGAGATPVWSQAFFPGAAEGERVLINSYDLTNGAPPDVITAQVSRLAEDIADQLDGSVTVALTPMPIGPFDGYHTTIEGTANGKSITLDEYFVFVGATEYEINCVAGAEPTDQLTQGCQLIRDSFAVD